MAIAPFFERVYGALGGHLAISRESLNNVLESSTVGIHVNGRLTQNEKWIAELCANLIARLYPRISISGASGYSDHLHSLSKGINPDIEILTRAANGSTTISIGSESTTDCISPQAEGWVARLSRGAASKGPSNPFSSGAAACLACAELFRRVFLKQQTERDYSVSLLTYSPDGGADFEFKKTTDIREVLFVGVGAVGNAGLWALSRVPGLSGSLHTVDAEVVTLSNLQRYALTTIADVGTAKVAVGARHLETNTRLAYSAHQVRLEDLPEASNFETIVVSLDNVAGRRASQALLPRVAINGWTGDQALGASWHQFSNGKACVACLYHPHGQGASAVDQAAKALGLPFERAALLWVTRQPLSEEDVRISATSLGVDASVLSPWLGKPLGELYTDVVCGAVPLDVTGVGRVEVVPLAHQSVLAGILMTAELIKRTSPKISSAAQPEPLVSWDDVLKAPPTHWVKPRAQEPGCICGDADYQARYSEKWTTASRGSARRG